MALRFVQTFENVCDVHLLPLARLAIGQIGLPYSTVTDLAKFLG